MKMQGKRPPKFFMKVFRWYCHPKLREHIEGDLVEVYNEQVQSSKLKADINFILDVVLLCRPGIIKPVEVQNNINNRAMLKSYIKIGWRNLIGNMGYSVINIGGLAIGMTVAMFIGLWIHDETSFNKYHENFSQIGQIQRTETAPESGEMFTGRALQMPVGATLKANYSQYFKHVLMAWWPGDYTVSRGEEKLSRKGMFIESPALEMFSLKMKQGTYSGLEKQNSIVISQSMAEAIFGNEDPMNKSLRINSSMDVEVTGVYEDIPRNNNLGDIKFFAPWPLWISANRWLHNRDADWDNQMTNTYVQLEDNTSAEEVNAAIKDMFSKVIPADFYATIEKYKPYVQVVPMSTWHLYSEFENGEPAGGRITFVWLFGIVGTFVLMLACINFINLSTARSEKRAREVGIRKAVGSIRKQLVMQFLSESFMVVTLAFVVAVLFLVLLQTSFNQLADKDISLPFAKPMFWGLVIGFIAFTGIAAGMYPAFYLSSFQPAKVLKGALRLGRFGSLPRKVLVVVQFSVSVILVIGTLVVYKQIQFARERPVGYNRSGLISMRLNDPGFKGKIDALRAELLATGVVSELATASAPMTDLWNTTGGYSWPGKDPNFDGSFGNVNVTYEFGKTVGWEVVAGRDFSREFATDSTHAVIINEAAAKYMGLENPVGEKLVDIDEMGAFKWSWTIVGVVKDLVVASPYEPVLQTIYYMNANSGAVLHIRIDPSASATVAIPKIKEVVNRVVPSAMFDYKFVDDEFATKFSQEERVGRLAAVFAVLAIFISCLGLFGLASFVAEQRTKEIGIRKVMGASIGSLWKMLSRDFVILVIVACFIAIPVGYFVMNLWLEKFEYRTDISWWVFVSTCLAAVLITLLTVSYQSIKAAMMNPVKSLRTE
jgi:ABC-type antimicrobial peptide transport system permease subunit